MRSACTCSTQPEEGGRGREGQGCKPGRGRHGRGGERRQGRRWVEREGVRGSEGGRGERGSTDFLGSKFGSAKPIAEERMVISMRAATAPPKTA